MQQYLYYLVQQIHFVPRSHHPSSSVGQPGRSQGFNTGVVLFHLARMRASPLYRAQTGLQAMLQLHTSFLPSSDWGLGDQVWTLQCRQYPRKCRLWPGVADPAGLEPALPLPPPALRVQPPEEHQGRPGRPLEPLLRM